MLRALAIAATLALLLSPAAAQQQQQKDEHKNVQQQHPGGGGGPPPPHPNNNTGGGPPQPHPQFKPVVVPHGPPSGGPSHPPGPPPTAFHPTFHPSGPQFTYHGHPFNRMHVHPFHYPPGWAYREWVIGAILPGIFLTPDYYYTDWAALGLDPPPPGDEWVRYGPDLLLVDTTTGQVVQVIYGVFYED